MRRWRQGVLGILIGGCAVSVALADPPSVWPQIVRPWLTRDARPAATPTEAIKALDATLSGYHTGADITPEQREENRRIKERVVRGTFDLRELSRIALGKHWTVLADAQRNQFVDLMIDLLEHKGVLSKEQGQKNTRRGAVYSIQYRGDKFLDPLRRRALARTAVTVPSRNLRVGLDYKLHAVGSEWKIYDVIVDGSSLLENYQYQFDSIITKHGFGELLARMQRKRDEFAAEHEK
ncbi:MAG: ABC transporter substrate-binding protein [Deltaproteobacteria bacterium]|nr:ABC transporter substrate-binding protein [Deltaproteobacteria bacterium]